jgi:hypothetical protein
MDSDGKINLKGRPEIFSKGTPVEVKLSVAPDVETPWIPAVIERYWPGYGKQTTIDPRNSSDFSWEELDEKGNLVSVTKKIPEIKVYETTVVEVSFPNGSRAQIDAHGVRHRAASTFSLEALRAKYGK